MANYRGVKLNKAHVHNSGNYAALYDLLKFAMAWSTAVLYFKFLLIPQHEVPFINTSEATKRSSDPTENDKLNERFTPGANCFAPVQRYLYIPENTLEKITSILNNKMELKIMG